MTVQMTPHLVCKTRVFDGEGNKIEKLKLFYCCEILPFLLSSNCLSVLVKYHKTSLNSLDSSILSIL